ncbi:MAG: hypothetical protein EAZ74_00070 [Alphaproteobacteria bacterium]|nr:MAG: hypothetical protein EAY76_02405 [Alphaproteobacteria bacterium]TAF16059.1 MAG: hypothetical protein EAZ74_00070 [Alphaproteobacteria bacterium]TAF40636.1 MAG: hypothetical protein EAZ66_02755 [Alphaproteobacteria bacterium]TAF75933.1 MAG: hypothetical protein EAZ52_05565 [Alphaproteobacteria bacterium]
MSLAINDDVFSINLRCYFFLKYLVKVKLSDKNTRILLEQLIRHESASTDKVRELLEIYVKEHVTNRDKQEIFLLMIEHIQHSLDIRLFAFSVRLYIIKDVLLAEAKLKNASIAYDLAELHPLSLDYDNIIVFNPYNTRVQGALLVLLFFQKIERGEHTFLSEQSSHLLECLVQDMRILQAAGLEPNQMFMLMFTETMNQSITSASGSNYESRLKDVLVHIGIPRDSIRKAHDSHDISREFDLIFSLEQPTGGTRTYGIGAKRTLRERYKQFTNTADESDADILIQVTLGLDLNEAKANTIVVHKGVILFVADEIYDNRSFLQSLAHVYPVSELTIETLYNLPSRR